MEAALRHQPRPGAGLQGSPPGNWNLRLQFEILKWPQATGTILQVSVEAAALVEGDMPCPKDWVDFEDQRDLPLDQTLFA